MKKTNKALAAPKFKNEAEEAQWWHDNQGKVEQSLINAMEKGIILRGTAKTLSRQARTSKNVTIRMAESDLALARKQAEAKGLPYQTYIKSLLHQALVK